MEDKRWLMIHYCRTVNNNRRLVINDGWSANNEGWTMDNNGRSMVDLWWWMIDDRWPLNNYIIFLALLSILL